MSTLATIRRRHTRRTRPVLLLTDAREVQGLTQVRLSDRAKVCSAIISGIETGRVNPTHHQLAALSRALDVYPPEALLWPVTTSTLAETV